MSSSPVATNSCVAPSSITSALRRRSALEEQQKHQCRLEKKRKYYQWNRESEQEKARKRASRRKALPLEDQVSLAERHRQAQARYREKNRGRLAIRSWEYRVRRKQRQAILNDEEEYQRLMVLADAGDVEMASD